MRPNLERDLVFFYEKKFYEKIFIILKTFTGDSRYNK